MSQHPLLHDERVLRWGLRAAFAVLAAGLAAFIVEGANLPDDPYLGPPTTAPPVEE